MSLSLFIRAEMSRRQWSQADLAKTANIPRSTLNSLLRHGRKSQPEVKTLRALAGAFDQSVDDLLAICDQADSEKQPAEVGTPA